MSKSSQPTPIAQPTPAYQKQVSPTNSKKNKGCGCGILILLAIIFSIIVVVILFNFFGSDDDSYNDYDNSNPSSNLSNLENNPLVTGELTKENNTISNNGASLSISPDYVQQPVQGSITAIASASPIEGLEMDIYEIYMENSENYSGLYNIVLPYNSSRFSSSQNLEKSMFILHYNEATQEWGKPSFRIDTTTETIHFETTHLSPAGVVSVLENFDPNSKNNVAGGTVDISTKNKTLNIPIKVFIPSSNVNANFGVFNLTTEDHLLNTITGYNEDLLFENLKTMDPELNTFVKLNSDSELLGYTLSSMGFSSSFMEYFSAGTGNFEAGTPGVKLATRISHLGMMITAGQFINDIDKDKPLSSSFWGLLKGAIYYKGAYTTTYIVGRLATTAVGATAGEFVAVGLAGMWVFEQAFMPVEDIFDYTSGGGIYYHQRYISGMKDFLAATDPLSESDWYKIVQTLHEVSIETLEPGEDPALHFKTVVETYIKNYTQQYFDQSRQNRMNWLINTQNGGLYGHPDLFHYYDFGQDEMEIKKYENKISESSIYDIKAFGNLQDYDYETFTKEYGESLDSTNSEVLIKVPGTTREYTYNFTDKLSDISNENFANWYMDNWADNQALQDEIKALYIKEIFNEYIAIHLDTLTRIEVNKIWHSVCSEMDTLVADLNKVYTIEFIDENVTEKNPVSSLNGYVLVPVTTEYDKWKITLDEKGQATLKFTLVEYLTSGNFLQFNMYNAIDGAGTLSIAQPVSVYNFALTKEVTQISLAPAEQSIVGIYSYKNEMSYFFGFTPDGIFISGDGEQVLMEKYDTKGTYTFDPNTNEGYVDENLGGFKIVLNGDILSVYTNDGTFFVDYYRVPKE